MITLRKIGLVVFFGTQMILIILGYFSDTKYFCWVPYDQISLYSIEVKVDNRFLSREEIQARYRQPSTGRENRNIENLISIIQQYESTYGADQSANVKLTYQTNGKELKTWELTP
ncbi:hypothetical protein [Marinoscillum sp.]|uniref:hypothetical protein n=1 Tax=Marinoscillum sp. TaxID=2024838 RepID=UPI003BAC496D